VTRQRLTAQDLLRSYSEMRERIALLERELDEVHAANRENKRIIAALTQQIPELEAPAEPPRSPAEHLEDEESLREDANVGTRPDTQRLQWHERRYGAPAGSPESAAEGTDRESPGPVPEALRMPLSRCETQPRFRSAGGR
jgi:hypothetical protein